MLRDTADQDMAQQTEADSDMDIGPPAADYRSIVDMEVVAVLAEALLGREDTLAQDIASPGRRAKVDEDS